MSANAVVFSMNRAMQLDALLQSVRTYAPCYPCLIILYRWTTSDFKNGYEILRGEYPEHNWIVQTPEILRDQILSVLDTENRLSTLLCDDDVFYRPMPAFCVEPDTAYAPRLGKNCTHCWNCDIHAAEVRTREQKAGELDFAARISIDGHVYRTDELKRLIAGMPQFSGPQSIESYGEDMWEPRLVYDEHSCLVGIPNNLVRTDSACRHMGGSAEVLNRKFLAGDRIDLPAMDFSNVYSAHMPIEYVFRRLQ